MSQFEAKPGQSAPRQYFVPYFVLAFGLLFTAFFSYYIWRTAQSTDQTRFNTSTQELTTYVRGRPRLYIEVLRAGAGLFAVNPSITPSQFRNFVERLELAEQYRGAQGIGFLARVKAENKDAFKAILLQRGQDLTIWPDQNPPEYFPVVYFEPLDGHKPVDMGFDMFSEPVRRAAMEKARDTGLPATTARVMLSREKGEPEAPGFLIYAPIYENDRTPRTVDERREALSGFVYSRFRAADFIAAVKTIKNFSDIDVRLYDGEHPAAENLFHDSATVTSDTVRPAPPRFTATGVVDVAGRTWTIGFASRPEFASAANRNSVYYAILAGSFISLLLFVLTHLQVKARAQAEHSAVELRTSEARVRKTLTDRELAEEALRESEERYRELVENANDIVFTLDLEGHVTSINKAVESITGYSQTELIGMNMSEFLTPTSTDSARNMTERKLAGEERTNYEVDVLAKDGRTFTLEVSSRLAINQGKPVGVQGVARDITNRRQAEESLREADQRALTEYERLIEKLARLAQALGTARDLNVIFEGLKQFALLSVPCDGLFVALYDPLRDVRIACYGWGDGEEIDTTELPPMPVNFSGPNSRAVRTNQVVITNDYMSEMLGHPSMLVGPDNGLRPQSSLSAPMSVMGRVIGTIEVQTYQKMAYGDAHETAMRMAANLTAVAIENVRLLERESTARASAEESNRLKDEFLATVSHELRTPLTAILGWSRMLQDGTMDSDMAQRAIDSIKRNAKAQAQIIDDILDVSRIITGNLYLELHPIDLAPILEAAINVVRPTADAKGIQILVNFEPEPAAVPGDANRLQQVFWNLLSNAVKFTPSGGRVTVSLAQVDGQVEVEVRDSGQGISAEFLPFVFDRFRQQDSTSTRLHGGLGLGLAIARHLVEIHGGHISAKSPGEGEGAAFTVNLPMVGSIEEPDLLTAAAAEINAEAESQERLRSQALSGLHVLLVDDDQDTLELLSAALTQRSANVTAVLSAAEAVASIKDCRPDLLISDIAMPGEDGHELMRKVLALKLVPRLPAIAITAYAKEEDKERALAAGYERYLAKPVELRDFIATVAEVARLDSRPLSAVNGLQGETVQ